MKITERLSYLLIILGLVLFNVGNIWWFNGHYDFLNNNLNIIAKNCKKGIHIFEEKPKKSCPYNNLGINN